MKFKKTICKVILCILVVLAISSIVRNTIKNKKVVNENPIKNVSVIQTKLTSLNTSVDYSGKLVIDKQISISPKSPGKIDSLNVKEGSSVKSGEVLFTLNSDSLKAQLEQQEASIASANANLERTKSSEISQQILQAQQTIKSSQINYDDSKSNYDKMQKLYSAGAVAKQDLDASKTKLDTASAALDSAKQNLNLIQQKIGPESVEVAQAQVSQAEAGIKSIQTQIEDNTIRSPISGIVSSLNIHQGEISPTGQPSLVVMDLSSLVAEITVPDKMLSKIKINQCLSATIPALSNKKLTGKVTNISSDIDSKTMEYTVKIKISGSDNSLKPGMFCKISLPDESKNNIITVPNQAIKIENGVSYLYTVKNKKVQKISVNTGLSNDEITEIISPQIHPGDNIIPEGQTFLNDGDKVKIIN
ncbi:efflux RND transporter periplasmic adaptor subunit [Clostridium tyrobutyricum]|uniref:efflux RND transporter periplasmic adaptor subunit n=1 Tax=Clostridium tyrobutyricum TaxID=1519 RepID=UPI001C3803DF|nr:efflux RND transporter periplasmic adaptor subunit [Clostridium tyrobutyricum]MBV4428040.1 efflux RND transporter periplasmic adaptor subunit [Clostridium tyrobutyricum]MBV4444726.1 efflux RND transporter periplasmic adaptor subunit [Clostridium tyrobutyricum]